MAIKDILIIMIVIILFVPSLGLGDWSADNHDFQNTSSTSENGPEPPLKFLWNPEKVYIGGDWLAPIVHGDVVYLVHSLRYCGNFTTFAIPVNALAVNISDGKILWYYNNTKLWDGATMYAFYKSGILYIDSGGILGVNATTGRVLRRVHYIPHSTSTVWKNYFYMSQAVKYTNTSTSVRIYAINLKTGKEV